MKEDSNVKRGWVLDVLMAIGHQEAKLTHTDEAICNHNEDIDNLPAGVDTDTLTKLVDKLKDTRDAGKASYMLRALLCDDLFAELPEADREMICEVKHDAATYVLVAEKYHAQGFTARGELELVLAGKVLAFTCSRAFGLEPMGCLRCLNDAMNAKLGFDQKKTMEEA